MTDVALLDAVRRGWFNNDSDELFHGFRVGPDDVVVDVGCGDGRMAAFCGRRGASVILADTDAVALVRAVGHARESGARAVEWHVVSGERLPIADAIATRVVCTEALEHVSDPATVIHELARIGKPGALYVITTPHPVSEGIQRRVAPDLYFAFPHHVRVVEREDVLGWARDAGLIVETVTEGGAYWTLWMAMFWICGVPIDKPNHPLLDGLTRVWGELLTHPHGEDVRPALDRVLPNTHTFLLRKPCETGASGLRSVAGRFE